MNNFKPFSDKTQTSNNQSIQHKPSSFQWRPFLALLAVVILFFTNLDWAWGILFLYWIIPDIFTGTTYFIEPVQRKNNPFLFWSIVFCWTIMSLFLLSTLFF